MRSGILMAGALALAGGAGWMGYQSGQWHYMTAIALAPLLWLATRG